MRSIDKIFLKQPYRSVVVGSTENVVQCLVPLACTQSETNSDGPLKRVGDAWGWLEDFAEEDSSFSASSMGQLCPRSC